MKYFSSSPIFGTFLRIVSPHSRSHNHDNIVYLHHATDKDNGASREFYSGSGQWSCEMYSVTGIGVNCVISDLFVAMRFIASRISMAMRLIASSLGSDLFLAICFIAIPEFLNIFCDRAYCVNFFRTKFYRYVISDIVEEIHAIASRECVRLP